MIIIIIIIIFIIFIFILESSMRVVREALRRQSKCYAI